MVVVVVLVVSLQQLSLAVTFCTHWSFTVYGLVVRSLLKQKMGVVYTNIKSTCCKQTAELPILRTPSAACTLPFGIDSKPSQPRSRPGREAYLESEGNTQLTLQPKDEYI